MNSSAIYKYKNRVFKQVPNVLFGKGSVERVAELIPSKLLDKQKIIFVDSFFQHSGDLVGKLKNKAFFENSRDLVYFFDAKLNEPHVEDIDGILALIKQKGLNPEVIIGAGGGSTMDVAKAVSVMLRNLGSAADYQGWDLVENDAVFKIGIPTIFGSGAEASRTAVLSAKEKKQGINSDKSMFNAIIIDSNLSQTVDPQQFFHTAMDCYIHCIESLQGTMINTLSKSYASQATDLCRESLLKSKDMDQLASASYLGGVSIVNSEVGLCHALSYGLSVVFGYRHGIANCIAFRVLGEYYAEAVNEFEQMVKIYKIELPSNVTKSASKEQINKLIQITKMMEKPLTNALGDNWSSILTDDKIALLYSKM